MRDSVLEDAPALARKLMDAIDAGDLGRAGGLLDDSFQLHYNGVPDPIAKATFLEMIEGYRAAFADMRHELLETLPSGDHLTLRLIVHATHRGVHEGIEATGRQVSIGAIHILRIANGKVVEWWAAEDDLGLLRQIGAVVSAPTSA